MNTDTGMNYVSETVKKYAKSPIFLFAIIAYSAYAVINLFFRFVDLIRSLGPAAAGPNLLTVVIGFFVVLPMIAICLSLWLIYADAVDAKEVRMKSRGYRFLLYTYVVNVVTVIANVIYLNVSSMKHITVSTFFGEGFYDQLNDFINDTISAESIELAIKVIVIIILVFSIALTILMAFFTVKSLLNVEKTLKTGIFAGKASTALGVLMLIIAASNGVSFLRNFPLSFNATLIFNNTPRLLLTLFSILFAILIFNYNKEIVMSSYMKAISENPAKQENNGTRSNYVPEKNPVIQEPLENQASDNVKTEDIPNTDTEQSDEHGEQ